MAIVRSIILSMMFTLVFSEEPCKYCCKYREKREGNQKMTYTYVQESGRFFGGDGDYYIDTTGYSGFGKYQNNPDMQDQKNKGPAPVNEYTLGICKDTMFNGRVRPCTFPMNPKYEDKMFGRNGISIHGCHCCDTGYYSNCDYQSPPCPSCSQGCIIIDKESRKKLRTGDTIIVVRSEYY